jgi:hypothetical protein
MIPNVDVSLRAFEACDEYDILIGALGYEARASSIPSVLQTRSMRSYITVLDEVPALSFEANRALFSERGFVELVGEGDTARQHIAALAEGLQPNSDSVLKIALDVSSLTRERMAYIVLGLCDLAISVDDKVFVDFWYTPGIFEPPSTDDFVSDVSEPVTPEFAGWSSRPELPTSLIIGVGYEHEKALGAVEYLDPARIWCFVPEGNDDRFDKAVAKANQSMWQSSPQAERITYPVTDPIATYTSLESLVYGLERSSRPILLPFGPKIFAACSLLIGVSRAPNVTVWRVSGGKNDNPRDCVASPNHVHLPMQISPIHHKLAPDLFHDQMADSLKSAL